jgi:hypothetical protein
MKLEQLVIGIGIVSVMGLPMSVSAMDSKSITLKQIGRYSAGASTVPDEPRAEISAYDPASKRLFSINLNLRQLDVLDLSAPESPVLVQTVALSGKPNSVTARNGIVAVALEGAQKTDPGSVKFFNASGTFLNQLTVGALPDMLVFSPNGHWLLVANEGEPNSYNQADSVDPDGSVSVIDMRGDVTALTQLDVRTAGFSASIPQENPSSIRVFGPNATISKDLEPEYITVSHDSKTAWVTLQENNAIATLDIPSATFTKIVGLGFKDHLLTGNKLDASDRDTPGSSNLGIINITNWPVLGMYQPDSIASYRVKEITYLVTANEGDARDYTGFAEEARVGALALDATTFAAQGFPDVTTGAVGLRNNDNLGRLTVTNTLGNTDGDAEFEKLYVFGARSFSIRKTNGELVYDSGDDLEQRTKELVPATFNSNGTVDTFDTRSDNKGPEPEGLAIGKVSGRTYAFIGLERTGGIMVYDISNPEAPQFVTYANTTPTDLAPEGLIFIKRKDSPNGKPLVVVSHEASNTVTIFEIVTDSSKEDDGEEDDEEAALVSLDYVLPGDGLLTRDRVSKLDWLDVTQTVNQTYDQVRTGPYYSAGFRHAMQAEVETLFLHAGMPYNPLNHVTSFLNEARNLVRLLGLTIDIPEQGRESTYAFTGTDFFGNTVTIATHPMGTPFSAQLAKIEYVPSIPLGEAHFGGGHPFSNEAAPIYGSFLVQPVSRR